MCGKRTCKTRGILKVSARLYTDGPQPYECRPVEQQVGTDLPQDQIQAFRTFQISEEFQDRYGYPKMTPRLRAQIFGLNAAKPYGIDVGEVLKQARNDAVERRRTDLSFLLILSSSENLPIRSARS